MMTTTTTEGNDMETATGPADFTAPIPTLVLAIPDWYVSYETGSDLPDGAARLNIRTYDDNGQRIGDPIIDGRVMKRATIDGRIIHGAEAAQRVAWAFGYLTESKVSG